MLECPEYLGKSERISNFTLVEFVLLALLLGGEYSGKNESAEALKIWLVSAEQLILFVRDWKPIDKSISGNLFVRLTGARLKGAAGESIFLLTQ